MKKVFGLLTICLLLSNMGWAQEGRIPAKGFAVDSKEGHFHLYEFTRHAVGDNDVLIEILYAGICHSDLHSVWSEHGESRYPMVPGHEIVGRVIQAGNNVTKFKVGDYAGVGCMVNSCGHCAGCEADMEQSCEEGAVYTYGFPDRFHVACYCGAPHSRCIGMERPPTVGSLIWLSNVTRRPTAMHGSIR